jgi:hypothetical protein
MAATTTADISRMLEPTGKKVKKKAAKKGKPKKKGGK